MPVLLVSHDWVSKINDLSTGLNFMKKHMTRDEELPSLNASPEEDIAEMERTETMRRSVDPGRWQPITDSEKLEFIENVKKSIGKKMGRPPRQVQVKPIHMKWPVPLLDLVQKYAALDGLDYQSFIRTTVAKELQRREKQGA